MNPTVPSFNLICSHSFTRDADHAHIFSMPYAADRRTGVVWIGIHRRVVRQQKEPRGRYRFYLGRTRRGACGGFGGGHRRRRGRLGRDQFGVELMSLVVFGFRFHGMLGRRCEHLAELIVGLGVLRVEANRGAQFGLRFGSLALLGEHRAEVRMIFRLAGIEREGRAILRLRHRILGRSLYMSPSATCAGAFFGSSRARA